MNDETNFCTDCGASNQSVNEFCIGCGARMKSSVVSQVKESPAVLASATMSSDKFENVAKILRITSPKNLIILVAAVLVSFVVGAGLASENVFSGIVGNRYTEKRLENEKKQSYEIGYNSGKSDGYDIGYEGGSSDGYSRGYSRGEIDGCNAVFDEVGADQLIAIFYPYNAFNLGKYYSTRLSTC